MRGKTYYIAKNITVAAPAVYFLPLLWHFISNYMIDHSLTDSTMYDYGDIRLIGQVLIPTAAAISLILAVIGTVFSAVSKKQGDIGAGKLIAADIIIISVAAAVIALICIIKPELLAALVTADNRS